MKQDSYDQPSFGLPVCPYCGRRLNPFVAWLYKTKGEYRCPSCFHFSNVLADRKTPIFGILAVGISLAVFLIFLFANGKVPLWAISLIVAPFLLFTLLAPFLVRLEKVPETAPKPERLKNRQQGRQQRQLPRVAPTQRPTAQQPQTPPLQAKGARPAPHTPPPPQKREPLSPYSHPASRPPQYRTPQNVRPPAASQQSPARSPKPNLYPSMPPASVPRSQPGQRPANPPATGRPAPTGRPVQTNRPAAPRSPNGPNAKPNLFDTAEFGKRAPRDFSGYQDK